MIITFCGHADFRPTVDYEKHVLALLDKLIGDSPAYLYLGGYGAFDEFAYACGKKFKEKNKNVKLVFITPYITLEYQKNQLSEAQKKIRRNNISRY